MYPVAINHFSPEDIRLFKSRINYTDTCWFWTGSKQPSKAIGKFYGRFFHRHASLFAHRVAYVLHGGILVDGMTIDHLCGNTLCVNPKHLEQVTLLENLARYHRSRPKSLTCKRGHDRAPGTRCKRCAYEAIRRSVAKRPDHYRSLGSANKRKNRQLKRLITSNPINNNLTAI